MTTNLGDDHTTGTGLLAKDTVVGHYRISSKIGSGGMGDVYLADDTKLNRQVALKFLPSHLAADTTLRARFTREVQAVAALNHPNIVHVYEVSEFHQRPFFAMEYVEGAPLREQMRAGRMAIADALGYVIGLCEGLEAAHKVGIVHRDIKPANIVIANSGRVKILDFGLAKRASDPTLTSMGSTLGTICYMSPEQVQGRESDNRSDLFSVGIVLYEMVAGRLPFRGDYDAATLTAIVSDPHEPLVKFRPDAPPKLAQIVDRLLAKDPAQRYQNVTALLVDLAALRDELKFGAAAPAGGKSRARGPLVAIIAVTVLLGAAAIALLALRGSDKPAEQASVSQPATSESAVTDQSAGTTIEPAPVAAPSTAQSEPVRDRSAFVAESTGAAAESERLRILRDSIANEKARLTQEQAQLAARQVDTTPRTGDGRWERAVPPPPRESAPTAPAVNRSADSTAIAAAVARFWKTLEAGRINDLRKAYPSMPDDWTKMWRTFTDFAKELKVESTIRDLSLKNSQADADVRVKMAFRDRNGAKSEDVLYRVNLTKQNNDWTITKMERDR